MRSATLASVVAVIGSIALLVSSGALPPPALATGGSGAGITTSFDRSGTSAPLPSSLFTLARTTAGDCCHQFGFDPSYPGGWPGAYGPGYPGAGWPGAYGLGYPGGWPGAYGLGYGGGWGSPYGYGYPGGWPGSYGLGYPGGGWPGGYGLGGSGYPGGGFLSQPGAAPAAPGGGQASQPAAAQVTASRLTIGDNYFLPAQISFPAGSRLSWYNSGNSPHTVTSPGNWDSGSIAPGSRWAADFRQPGTYSYQCTIHPEMQAVLTITP